MAAKNDNIIKDPSAAGKKGGSNKKGKKHTFTKIKEKLLEQGLSWDKAEELVEANMLDFLNAPDKKTRMFATRYFSEFVKPKKKELSGELGLTVEDYLLKRKDKE